MALDAAGLAKCSVLAYRAAALSQTSDLVVPFDTEETNGDLSGVFDTVTNVGRFTPNVRGRYRITACVQAAPGTDNYVVPIIRKNGSVYRSGASGVDAGADGFVIVAVSALVDANGTTDYFDIRVDHNKGSAMTFNVGAANCYFQAELVGRLS